MQRTGSPPSPRYQKYSLSPDNRLILLPLTKRVLNKDDISLTCNHPQSFLGARPADCPGGKPSGPTEDVGAENSILLGMTYVLNGMHTQVAFGLDICQGAHFETTITGYIILQAPLARTA